MVFRNRGWKFDVFAVDLIRLYATRGARSEVRLIELWNTRSKYLYSKPVLGNHKLLLEGNCKVGWPIGSSEFCKMNLPL